MKNKNIFCRSFVAGFLLASGWFVWLTCWYLPNLDMEGWLREVLWCKLDIAARTPSPKIIILSGSNGFFGMDSAIMEKRCGMPVVNLAFHAAFPINCYQKLLTNVLQEGNLVVMPLEFEHYSASSGRNKITMFTGFGWGREFFPPENRIENALFYIFSDVWSSDFITNIPRKIKKRFRHPPPTKKATLEWFHQLCEQPDLRTKQKKQKLYSFENMNRYGDIIRTENQKITFPTRLPTTVPTDFCLRELRALENFVHEKKAEIVLTWPVIYCGNNLRQILDLKRHCREKGITIHGDPEKFMFPPEDFSDTCYHLRSSAAPKRTEILADCILESNLLPTRPPSKKITK